LDFRIGGLDNGAGFQLDGVVDEVRVSKNVRGDAWIKAQYYAQNDNIGSWGSTEGKVKRKAGDVDHDAGTTLEGVTPATLVAGKVPQSQRLWLPPRLETWSRVSGPTPAFLTQFSSPDVGKVVVFTATDDASHYAVDLDEDDTPYDGCDLEVWLTWGFVGVGNLPGDEVKWELSLGTYLADGSENVGTGASWGMTTSTTLDLGGLTEWNGYRVLLGTYTGGEVGDEILGYKLLRLAQNWSDLSLSYGIELVRA